jgi:ABC-type antimicrobial peptide transport system permease subunit
LAVGRSVEDPTDRILTFVASGLAIVAIAVIAASVPALRAARIDPVGALRQE